MKTAGVAIAFIFAISLALAAGRASPASADPALFLTLDTPHPQGYASFGWSVAVGDANGDGYADVTVGASSEDTDGITNQGRAYVFSGADGSLLFTLDIPNPQENAAFGSSLAMGDVNGDGLADIAVGADHEDVGDNTNQGRAYVFSLAPVPVDATLSPTPTPGPAKAPSTGIGVSSSDAVSWWPPVLLTAAAAALLALTAGVWYARRRWLG